MSQIVETSTVPEDELVPSETPGYKVGEKKSLAEYAEIDKEDESLNKWKKSLGLGVGGGAGGVKGETAKVSMITLSLVSPSRPTPIELDLTKPEQLAALKKNPVIIKEGCEYASELKFHVTGAIITGLRYIQVVRRAGINVDKLETMIGSFGPSPDPIIKRFVSEEAPSGLLARSGSYSVRSRVIDDDKNVHIDFEWGFKLGKEW